jgi:hypothetical protein
MITSETSNVPLSWNIPEKLTNDQKRRNENISDSEGEQLSTEIKPKGSQMAVESTLENKFIQTTARLGRVLKTPAHFDEYISGDLVYSKEFKEDESRINP